MSDIFSPDYLKQYNSLFYTPLCDPLNTPNCSLYAQTDGLNALLFYYFDYVIAKTQLYNAPTPPTLAQATNASLLHT